MSGIQSWSTASAGQSYVIFSQPADADFPLLDVPKKAIVGKYQGVVEAGWIVNARDWPTVATLVREKWRQESALILGPICNARGLRPAPLHNLSGLLPVNLGYFAPEADEHAKKQSAWTYDPATKQFYICRHAIDA